MSCSNKLVDEGHQPQWQWHTPTTQQQQHHRANKHNQWCCVIPQTPRHTEAGNCGNACSHTHVTSTGQDQQASKHTAKVKEAQQKQEGHWGCCVRELAHMSQFLPPQALDQKAANTARDEACELGDAPPAKKRKVQDGDKDKTEERRGARGLGERLQGITTRTVLRLGCEQQDHKQTQQESKASTMARGVAGQATRLVMKEHVEWVMHSRQTQR